MKVLKTAYFPFRMRLLIFTLLLSANIFAQDPNWTVNESEYEHTMTFLSFLTVDGNRLSSENDKVAVFVNGVCRGTTNLTYEQSQDSYYAFLTAFANGGGETMEIKIYDSQNDVVRDVTTTFQFEINEHRGSLFQAVSWANPVLSSEADIIDFSFEGIVLLDQNINNQDITIILEEAIDITALTPIYELSENADMFINTVPQSSGQDQLDFSNTISYQVRSHDQTALNIWTVTIAQVPNDIVYKRKNAVCYQSGAIQIASTQNGTDAFLIQNEVVIDTRTIENNEALFEGLEPGNYQVQIGNLMKEIEINLISN